MAKTADQWFEEYGESHQNPVNKGIHWVAVPLIFTSVVGLLWAIPVPEAFTASPWLNWATIALALTTLFYLRLSLTLGIGMGLFSVLMAMVVSAAEQSIPAPIWAQALTVFVVMWILQFIGHAVEGKKPSFFKDLQFLLIGPAWLMGFIYRALGIPY